MRTSILGSYLKIHAARILYYFFLHFAKIRKNQVCNTSIIIYQLLSIIMFLLYNTKFSNVLPNGSQPFLMVEIREYAKKIKAKHTDVHGRTLMRGFYRVTV